VPLTPSERLSTSQVRTSQRDGRVEQFCDGVHVVRAEHCYLVQVIAAEPALRAIIETVKDIMTPAQFIDRGDWVTG